MVIKQIKQMLGIMDAPYLGLDVQSNQLTETTARRQATYGNRPHMHR
jgi:hypothetical protein